MGETYRARNNGLYVVGRMLQASWAEEVSNSSNKIHQTTYKPLFRALYKLRWTGNYIPFCHLGSTLALDTYLRATEHKFKWLYKNLVYLSFSLSPPLMKCFWSHLYANNSFEGRRVTLNVYVSQTWYTDKIGGTTAWLETLFYLATARTFQHKQEQAQILHFRSHCFFLVHTSKSRPDGTLHLSPHPHLEKEDWAKNLNQG